MTENGSFVILTYFKGIAKYICLVASDFFQNSWNSSEKCHIAKLCSKLFKQFATSPRHMLALLEIGKFHIYSVVCNIQRATSHWSAEMLCRINIKVKPPRIEMVFCYHNCSNGLWEKIVLVWGKKWEKSLQIRGRKAENL